MLRIVPKRAAIVIFFTAISLFAQFRSTSTLVIAPTTVTDPTGKFIDGPDSADVPAYEVRVEGDTVFIKG